MIVVKEEAFTRRSLETRGRACHARPHGEAPGWTRSGRRKGEAWPRAFIGVFMERIDEAGYVCLISLVLDSLNNFGGLWTIGVVPSCQVPGLEMTESRGNIDLVCENLIKEMVGDVGSSLVGLYIKGILAGKLFALSRNQLSPVEAYSTELSLRCQSLKNTKIKRTYCQF